MVYHELLEIDMHDKYEKKNVEKMRKWKIEGKPAWNHRVTFWYLGGS